jgi:oligopeptide transport system substrate-binding protein
MRRRRIRDPSSTVSPTLAADPNKTTRVAFHLKKNIYFTPHPAFNGTRRELTAAVYVCSIKRIFDPKLKSQFIPWFERKSSARCFGNSNGCASYDPCE